MFQYTTETILNDIKDVKLFTKNYAKIDTPYATAKDDGASLAVDGVNIFNAKYVKAASYAPYEEAKSEIIEVTIPSLTKDEVYRLMITTSQEGIVSPIYADAQLRHKKPFFYEIVSEGDANKDAEALANLIEKEMSYTDFNFFKAEATGAVITLTADDCYTRFQTIQLAKVEHQTNNLTGFEEYKVVGNIDWKRAVGDIDDGASPKPNSIVKTVQKGTEGAGTVARLIKNLRVPTDANTDPFAADNGGRPVPGGEYCQFVIEYVTPRRHIGGQVMGALDQSITTHVFFTNGKDENTGITKDFYAMLKALCVSAGVTMEPVAYPTTSAKEVKPQVGSKQ